MKPIDILLNDSMDVVNDPEQKRSDAIFESIMPGKIKNRPDWEGNRHVGSRTDFGESQWDKGATASQLESGDLNSRRAELQPWYDQLGNMIGQAVVGEVIGGSIEGLGYLLDWEGMIEQAKGTEKEYTNWLSDIGKGLREKGQESMAIYEKAPGEVNFSDPGYWFKNGVSVASSLSMMVPSMAATKALKMVGKYGSKALSKGVSKGFKKSLNKEISEKALSLSDQMGLKSRYIIENASNAVISRHIENSMEASGTFNELYEELKGTIKPGTNETFSEEEARQYAAQAAADNYRDGWAMIAQDFFQFASFGKVFNPLSKSYSKAVNGVLDTGIKIPKPLKTLGEFGATFASEGLEEGYQHYIATRGNLNAKLRAGLISQEEYDRELKQTMTSDEAITSMFFGGLGGNIFQGARKVADKAFKSKDRKELESRADKNFRASTQERLKQIAANNLRKKKAEENDDVQAREEANDAIMKDMIINALNNNKLDSVLEMFKEGMNMTEEEANQFSEQFGEEFIPELVKQESAKAVEMAEELQKIHYKNLSSAKTKNLPNSIISAITAQEYERSKNKKKVAEIQKTRKDTMSNLSFTNNAKPSEGWQRGKELKMEIDANKMVLEVLTNELKATNPKDKFSKEHKRKLISAKRKQIKALEKEQKEINKGLEKLTDEEKASNEIADQALQPHLADISDGVMAEAFLDTQVALSNLESATMKTDEFVKEQKKNSVNFLINTLGSKEQLEEFKASLEKDGLKGYTSKEIKSILKTIDQKLAAIKAQEKVEAAKKADENYQEKAAAATEAQNANPATPDNNVDVVVEDGIEDEHRDEEIDFTEEDAESQEQADNSKVDNGKNLAPLDNPHRDVKKGPGKVFRTWQENGESKVGTEVEFELSTTGFHKSAAGKNSPAGKAYSAFQSALVNGQPATEEMYNHLPIKVVIDNNKGLFTFLEARPAGDGRSKRVKDWKNNSYEQRKIIIDQLLQGNKVVSEIAHTKGGELVVAPSINGEVQENSVLDLKQINGDLNKVKLVYSDKKGRLVNANNKEYNQEFYGRRYKVGENEDGTPRPYRGGLFLIINKADGTPFPVRMNFLKNTPEQAEVVADLLIDLFVPVTKGQKKLVTLDTPFNKKFIRPELYSKIKEVLGPELAMLGKEPKLKDIVNTMVYVSPETEGMTSELRFAGEHLIYAGGRITPGNRHMAHERANLIDFLANQKRRQFSLKMWNNTEKFPKYREYVLKNKIINTNVVIGEAEFQTIRDDKGRMVPGTRRIQMYIKPVQNTAPPKHSTASEIVTGTDGLADTSGQLDLFGDQDTPEGLAAVKAAMGIKETPNSTPNSTPPVTGSIQGQGVQINVPKSSENIEAKIADIESKRKELLNEVLNEKNNREDKDSFSYDERKLNEPYYVTYDLPVNEQKPGLLGKVGTLKGNTYEEIVKKINAKYDAELAELEQPTQQKPTYIQNSNIEAKKADIERKRQEEINSISYGDEFDAGRGTFRSNFGYKLTYSDVKNTNENKQVLISVINAKYDAELDALEPTQQNPSDVPDSLEAVKAMMQKSADQAKANKDARIAELQRDIASLESQSNRNVIEQMLLDQKKEDLEKITRDSKPAQPAKAAPSVKGFGNKTGITRKRPTFGDKNINKNTLQSDRDGQIETDC